MGFGKRKYILLGLCAVFLVASITFASAQAEISVSECSSCHNEVTFGATKVNRTVSCGQCHNSIPYYINYHVGTINKVYVEGYGFFSPGTDPVNVSVPDIHIKHEDSPQSCTSGCHSDITCDDCHVRTLVDHSSHGSSISGNSCENPSCHNKTTEITAEGYEWPPGFFTPSSFIFNITQTPSCENCHNDASVPLHNITAVHQSTITTECQTCHSNYLPDTHAEIANLSYGGDACSVCHQSTNPTVLSAIANNDTNCASCHTLHGDITEIHTLNTTTSTLNCPECHQVTYLPDLHNNLSVEKGLPTSCSLCHNNANISTSIASSECDSCHGNTDQGLPVQHLNANHTSVSDCIICHDDAELPIIHLDNCSVCHTNPTKVDIDSATNDCRSCHVVQDVGYHTSMNDTHSSTTDCTTCHETDLPTVHLDNCSTCHANSVINITLATADCNSCHVDQSVGFHTNMSDKHTSTSSCTNCHEDSYLPDLHNDFAVANNLTSCEVCHSNANITISDANSECTTCHGSQLPTQHANEAAKHTTNTCATCHGTNGGSYLPDTHNATVDNGRCDLCHNNVAIDISNSTSNCGSCHGPQVNDPHYNALIKHTFESPADCAACHDLYIPTTHADQYNNTNCFMCHRNNPAITELPTDKNCTSCHGSQLPVQHLNEAIKHNGSSSPECLSCHESSAGGNDFKTIHNDNCDVCHNNENVNYFGVTDCTDCHVDQNVGYHANMDDNHTTTVCANCHGTDGSAVLATVHNDNCSLCHNNPAIILPQSADCGYCHSSQTPNVDHHDTELSSLHAFEVPAECAGCHDMNLTGTHSTQSLDCDMCHATHGGSGPNLFVDFANAASVEGTNCFVCHDNADISTLPTDKNCSSCHGSQLPTQHVNESNKHNSSTLTDDCIACHSTNYLPTLHGDYGYDCTTCHNADPARIDWANSTITSSCDSCHTGHGDVNQLHNNMTSSECLDCHGLISNSTDIRSVHKDNCATCHSDTATVVYKGATDCTDCHSNTSGDATKVSYHVNESTSHSFTMCGGCHRQGTTPDAPGNVPTVHNATEENGGCVDLCHANPAIDMSIVDITQADYCYHCHGGFQNSPLPSPKTRMQSGHNFSSSSASAECMACHDESSDVSALHSANVGQYWTCVKCHESNLNGVNLYSNMIGSVPTDKNCSSCHDSQLPTQHKNEGVKHNSSTLTTECESCHTTNYLPTLHEGYGYNCTTCHKADSSRIDWVSGNINSSCDSCHVIHGDVNVIHTSTSTCTDCHDSDLRTTHNDTCSLCHGSTSQVTLPTNTNCTSCHDSQLPTQHANENVKHTSATLTSECTSCHTTNYLPTLHEGYGHDCNTCHNNADPSRIDWNTATSSCDSCHTLHGDLTVVHTTTASTGCAKCHDANVLTTHNEVCSTCHGNPVIPTLPSAPECTNCHGADGPVPHHNFQSGNSYHPTEVVGTNDMISSQAFVNGWSTSSITGCDDCHADRAADGLITLLNPYPQMYPDGRHNGQSSGDLCFNCHNYDTYAGNSNSDSNFLDGRKNLHPGNFGDHGDFGCYACHDVHTSTNRRLITDRVDPKTGDKWITSWVQHSGSYDEDDCVSSHPECDDHNPGSGSITPAVITGTVTYNGVAVPNAKVSSEKYGGIVAYTDMSGNYEMPNLYYGTYSLTATAYGDSQTESTSVNRGDSKVLNIDLTGTSTPPPQPTTGSIDISSSPSGATVYLDNTDKGTTPVILDGVSAGSHIVKLTMSGYADKEVSVNVIANDQIVVSETLTDVSTPPTPPPQPTTGSIDISSSPSGATVYLDNTNKGTTPVILDDVSAGSYTVKLTMSNYIDKLVNVDVIAGQQIVVSETLEAVPQTVSGEGYKLSKNPDFSTEDRDYSTSDTIYVKVWSDQVDYTDMNRMYFEIKDVTRVTLTNNYDGTFVGSYDLSRARRTGERDFKIRLEDERDEEYRVETKIDISGSSSYWRR